MPTAKKRAPKQAPGGDARVRAAIRGLSVIEGGDGRVAGHGAPPAESKYHALFAEASDGILIVLPSGIVDEANRAVEELTGRVRSELEGHPVGLLAPPPEKVPARARALTTEMFTRSGTYEDVALLRDDGYIRFVDLSVRLLKGASAEEGALAIGVVRDVTEKKRMERELITKHTELRDAYLQLEKKNVEMQSMQDTLVQSGKMAALGELAAGIAHELNQPLQGIRGYAQELQAICDAGGPSTAPPGTTETFLKEVVSNVDKMAAIIGYLRAFVRRSNEKHEKTSVHQALEEALKMLSRQFAARGIEVERQFAAKLPDVYANPLQLEQVFINLATNARDAIEAAGRGRGSVKITTREAGSFVEIVFKDDGAGMNERTKSKIFNPFFTTKEVGKGMGLGLSLSYGILSKLHGSMVVESEIGRGAAFTVRIPKDFRELA